MEFKTYSNVTTGLSYAVYLHDGRSFTLDNHVLSGVEDGQYVFMDLASRTDLSEPAGNVDMDTIVGDSGVVLEVSDETTVTSTEWGGKKFRLDEVESIEICPTSLEWLAGNANITYESKVTQDS